MSKDKSKKKSKAKKSKEVIEDAVVVEEFPADAAPAADETPATTEDTSTIKKKRRAEIGALALGESHELPHLEHLYRLKYLLRVKREAEGGIVSSIEGLKPKKAARLADQEIALYRAEGEARMHTDAVAEKASKKAVAADKVEAAAEVDEVDVVVEPELDAETQAAKARVKARRQERADALIAQGVDPEDAKNRALMSQEAEDMAAAERARKAAELIDVTVAGLEFEMPRRIRQAFLDKAREAVGNELPESGDFGRSAAKKKAAKAFLDGVIERLLDGSLDTTVADEIAAVESPDLGEPSTPADDLGDDPREGQDFDWNPGDLKITSQEGVVGETLTGITTALSQAEKLAAQVEADALDPDGHNIDDVLVKNGRPYLVPAGVEWDGQDESVLKPYTRVTNWIDVLDDKTQLTDWKLRTALVGLSALDELDPGDEVHLLDLVKKADADAVAEVAKLDKKSRKGKLDAGEYATAVDDVARAYKKTVDEIVERALEQGGAFEKAKRGTHLHAVFESFDEANAFAKGKLTVEEWVAERTGDDETFAVKGREVIPADIVDLVAYREAMDAAGIEVIECERRIVNELHGTTGTFDRGLWYKGLDGTGRRTRVIGDVKTGRIDYGAGKIAQQVEEYAQGDYYDPATGKREKTGYSKTVGILIHSPAGEGRTTIYEIDLKTGTRRNKLAVEVKAERARSTEAQAYRGADAFYKVVTDPTISGLHLTPGQRKKAREAAGL